MAVAPTTDPDVFSLERGDHTVSLPNLHRMSSAAIWDADPSVDPTANHTLLAALFPDHLAEIRRQQDEPLLRRPVYFSHERGTSVLRFWPHCDKAYWFRATFRPEYGTRNPFVDA